MEHITLHHSGSSAFPGKNRSFPKDSEYNSINRVIDAGGAEAVVLVSRRLEPPSGQLC